MHIGWFKILVIESRLVRLTILWTKIQQSLEIGIGAIFFSLSLSPWILHEINVVPLIMHEQSAWLLFETESCLAICIRSNVAIHFCSSRVCLFLGIPRSRWLRDRSVSFIFQTSNSLLLSIVALSSSSFTESKFALHGKTRRNVIHISTMIHLCSLSRLFIKRGSSETRLEISKHAR